MYIELFFASPFKKAIIYNKYLGISFGKNVRILHYPRWGSEPFLIEIGDNVTITRGVSFVNHDGGVALFRSEFPGLNIYGKIKIGNNVFIGINTIIMPNVTIGDNVVIGAGSIVNKNIIDNVVASGCPVKTLMTIDNYKEAVLKKSIQLKNSKDKRKQILEFLKLNN